MMELLLDLDDLSLDIEGDEKETRMTSLNPSHHRIKLFFNVPGKDDGDNGNDGDDGEENGDGDGDGEEDGGSKEDRSMAALTLTRCCWSVRPSICNGEGDKGDGDEGNGDEGL